MKTLREQFEDQYAAVSVPADNRRGFKIQYVYYAPWYLWGVSKSELKRKKILLTAMSIGSLLIFLLTGIQNSRLNYYTAVELAGTFALCLHIFELFGMVRFLLAKYRTNRMTYLYIDQILKIMPLVRGMCLAAGAAVGIYDMLRYAFQLQTAVSMAGYFVSALMALHIFREYRKIPLKIEKNEMTDKKDD